MTLTILLTAYVAASLLVFWLVTKRQRVVRPTTFEDQVRKFSEAMRQMQVAFADALTPTLIRVTESINRFNDVGAAQIAEFEKKHGPRPEGVPFLEWAASVEHNQDSGPREGS